jgi:hypothetical protein
MPEMKIRPNDVHSSYNAIYVLYTILLAIGFPLVILKVGSDNVIFALLIATFSIMVPLPIAAAILLYGIKKGWWDA